MTAQFADHAFGWSILGVCLAQLGRFDEAVAPMQKAVVLQPGNAGLHNNLANILVNLGRSAEAETSFRRVLTLQPDFPEALVGLGMALNAQGRFSEAEPCFRRAVVLRPDFATAHDNLGIALKQLRRLDEAEAAYRRALALQPNSAVTLNRLGATLSELGRYGEAEACFRHALALQPDFAEVMSNLGSVLIDQGRSDEAEVCFRRAVALRPDFAYAHNNLGNALRRLRRLGEAEDCFRRAVALQPGLSEAHSNLGSILIDQGLLAEAESSLRRALAIDPNSTDAYSNLLFAMNCRSDAAPEALAEARRYGQLVAGLAANPYTRWLVEERPQRLRVGLVSGDLRDHVVGYFLESLLREIDHGKIELIAYPTQPAEDDFTKRLRVNFAAWSPVVGMTDAAAAARIHADGVHILLDLSGHTVHNRLPVFAYKPAPVQATWLGYLATTGVEAIDYLIADTWTLPALAETAFIEKVWRLPETYICFTPPDIDVPVPLLPALADGRITFGSFNSLTKMTDEVVALWARVLKAVPGSRLYLKTRQLMESSSRQRVIERYAVHGIERDRLVLEDVVPGRAQHLATYGRMDIALDPFPYSGITTSAEALWMGVPVLTLAGNRFLSRQGVGLMMNAGLSDWVASDLDDYVARAVAHASDLNSLAALRATLRERFLASPVCDAKRFARHFEAALEGMWRARSL